MGDLITDVVNGTLYYVPKKEFDRILKIKDPILKTKLFSELSRINTLYMISKAGSGHIGSSFSSMEIMSWITLNELGFDNNIFFSSKGHDAPALYNIWIGEGKMNFEMLHKLRRIDGLPGHPDISTPNVVTNTGSLGMGVSKAKGMIFANRLKNENKSVYVLTGDGELQEGQFWESLISASNNKLNELTVIIDHNKLQSDTFLKNVSDLGDLESKLNSFGWHVERCDGNNLDELSNTFKSLKNILNKPKIIIADTIKGKGVSFMEHTSLDSDIDYYKFHSGAPNKNAYETAVQELIDNTNYILSNNSLNKLELEFFEQRESLEDNSKYDRLINAYSDALFNQARKNKNIIALDADLVLDTGLIKFKNEFPNRFLECGIAEQDMVSIAGGIALRGLIPIVHSFACFLSTRPNEQIYNNCTEKTKIIYVGSLAGILPGGPGHSHQAVRDISSLGSIPNLTLIEPSCEKEVEILLNWAINSNNYSTYIRLVSIPTNINFELPNYVPKKGIGLTIKKGIDIAIFSYGPTMLVESIKAASLIENNSKFTVEVINMPWLNFIDKDWFLNEVKNFKFVFSVDNHLRIGGLGDRISELISTNSIKNLIKFHKISLDEIPKSGSNSEVLSFHKLDSQSIKEIVLSQTIIKDE